MSPALANPRQQGGGDGAMIWSVTVEELRGGWPDIHHIETGVAQVGTQGGGNGRAIVTADAGERGLVGNPIQVPDEQEVFT